MSGFSFTRQLSPSLFSSPSAAENFFFPPLSPPLSSALNLESSLVGSLLPGLSAFSEATEHPLLNVAKRSLKPSGSGRIYLVKSVSKAFGKEEVNKFEQISDFIFCLFCLSTT